MLAALHFDGISPPATPSLGARKLCQIGVDLCQNLISQHIASKSLDLLQRHSARHVDLWIADKLRDVLFQNCFGCSVIEQIADAGVIGGVCGLCTRLSRLGGRDNGAQSTHGKAPGDHDFAEQMKPSLKQSGPSPSPIWNTVARFKSILRRGPVLLHCSRMTGPKKANQQLSDIMSHKGALPASSSSRDARAIRSGQALRKALLALLERKPFDQITVRDICAEAGVHYATFFRHHPTKETLLDDIATDQIKELNKLTLAIREADSYEAGFRALCAYVDDHRPLWSTLLNGGAGSAMREEWLRQSRSVAAKEPPVNSWLPTELGTIAAASLIAETLAWWVAQPPGAFSVDHVASILFRLLTTSIMAPD
jgi:AcrR family transcriptional regulator